MAGDDEVFVHESGDDAGIADEPRKYRGQGILWDFVTLHPTLRIAKEIMLAHNVPVMTRRAGRINRGKTMAFYYTCVKKSCGCTKEWKLTTELDSYKVLEEESPGDHINHDKEERNGGRGLSFDQVKIVDEAFEMGVKKPLEVIEFFMEKAWTQLQEDPLAVVVKTPLTGQVGSYLAANKRRRLVAAHTAMINSMDSAKS